MTDESNQFENGEIQNDEIQDDEIQNDETQTDETQTDEIQEEYEDPNICKQCGERYIDRTVHPDSILCADCRKEMIKLRIPPIIYMALAVVFALVAAAFFFFVPSLEDYAALRKADSLAGEGYPFESLDSLLDLLEKYPDSKDVAIEMVEIGMRTYNYDYADYAYDFLDGEQVSDSEYERLTAYLTQIEAYYNTVDLVDELGEACMTSMEEDGVDVNQALEMFCSGMIEYVDDTSYDKALLCYYIGYYTVDTEERMRWLEDSLGSNDKLFNANVQLANGYRRQGNFAKAREQLERASELNKEDASVIRSYASLELAEGNLEKALDYARTAYEMDPEADYVADTYIVALYANGRTDEGAALVQEWEEQEYYFDEDFYSFIEGNITLQDYYVGE